MDQPEYCFVPYGFALKLEPPVPPKPPPKLDPVALGFTNPPPPIGVLAPPIEVLLPTDPADPQVCFGYVEELPPTLE